MLNLSIDSPLFLSLLILGPIFYSIRLPARDFCLLLINSGIFVITMGSIESAIWATLFMGIPYIYVLLSRKKQILVSPFVAISVAMFVYLKGYNWIIQPITGGGEVRVIPILGLSYILFRQIDILIQCDAKRVEHVKPIDYINYTLSFWMILSGPIQRYQDYICSKGQRAPDFNWKFSLKHFHRAINGMIKVFIVSVFLKNISDASFALLSKNGFSLIPFLKLFYSYPLFVYINFSGYCDIVISFGALAGVKIPENFNKPYLARNMIEFWNRWHISLSEWIRDFIYQPLLKVIMTKGPKRLMHSYQYVVFFVTFIVVGVWHGNKLNFLVFGCLHGLGITLSLFYRNKLKKSLGKKGMKKYNSNNLVAALEIFVCMHYVFFTFLFFEYKFEEMIRVLSSILS